MLVGLVLAIAAPSVRAWGPYTHTLISEEAFKRVEQIDPTNSVLRAIKNYRQAFNIGLMIPDVAIIYYYTRFETYRSTHSWSWAELLVRTAATEEERAFAYGAMFHLIQDTVSHNWYIPKKLREKLIANAVLHPIVEAKVEARAVQALGVVGAYSMYGYEKFLPLTKETLGRDVSSEAAILNTALGGGELAFYENAYVIPGTTLLYKVYQRVTPYISAATSVEDAEPFLEETIERTVRYMLYGERPLEDPVGEQKLADADSYIRRVQTAVAGFVVLLILLGMWATRRGLFGRGR